MRSDTLRGGYPGRVARIMAMKSIRQERARKGANIWLHEEKMIFRRK